ncbi:alpha/beta hydrolase [Pseudoflavitalea sp. G-6-1-2]|uniref:alpha/beta hydrolase fold domain-containing protein n=1 Tax=Pseudoflavitalea sp. G-6-1-2 TaxID=2728841 RepID=UPI00146E98C2|nr:alpha/beta hydrolase fold domain-containing protein [Pseudoflavitalea sp. G-6-1-2]NML22084.1 alpha/beta hydrolase [Pseudoflavitalea sp. G-6-1-2]
MDNFLTEIKHFREFYNGLGKCYDADYSVTVQQETINGVSCYWFLPQLLLDEDIVISLHGGSYAMGSIHSHKAMLTHFASKLNRKILYIDYALAPELPYPAGVNDFLAVYQFIISHSPKTNMWLLADSAGGGILLSGLHRLQMLGLSEPAGVVMISPWIDLRCINESYDERKELDPILSREELLRFAGYYAGEAGEDADPSTLNFTHFPKALIMTGTREVLYDDAGNFYEKLLQMGADATFAAFESQTHVWPLTNIQSDAAQQMLDMICDFMN